MAVKSTRERVRNPLAPKQTDYVPHGSERHMAMLGLRPAAEGETGLVFEGFTLIDPTFAGPSATDRFLMETLRQKVREFKTAPVMPQSVNPDAPNYAPPMFTPNVGEDAEQTRGIV
jgi:hypothetical protein